MTTKTPKTRKTAPKKATTKKAPIKGAPKKKASPKRGVDGRFLSAAELARKKAAAARKRAAKKAEAEAEKQAEARRVAAKAKRDAKAKLLTEACSAVLERPSVPAPATALEAPKARGLAAMLARVQAETAETVIEAAEDQGVVTALPPEDDNVIRLADRIKQVEPLEPRSEFESHCSLLHRGQEITGHALSIQAFIRFRDQYARAHFEPRGSALRKEAAAYVRMNRQFVARLPM